MECLLNQSRDRPLTAKVSSGAIMNSGRLLVTRNQSYQIFFLKALLELNGGMNSLNLLSLQWMNCEKISA